jgi:hypothetical protein
VTSALLGPIREVGILTSDASTRFGRSWTLFGCGLAVTALSACASKTEVNVQNLEDGRFFFVSVRGSGAASQVRALNDGRAFRLDVDGNALDPLPIFDAPEQQGAEQLRLILVGIDSQLWKDAFPGFVSTREEEVRLMNGPAPMTPPTFTTQSESLRLPEGTLLYESDAAGSMVPSTLNSESVLNQLHMSLPWDFEWTRREKSDAVRPFVPVPLTFFAQQVARNVTQVRWIDEKRVVANYDGFLVLLSEGQSPCGGSPICDCAEPWCIDFTEDQLGGSAPWSIFNRGNPIDNRDKRIGEFEIYRDASETPARTYVVLERWFEPRQTACQGGDCNKRAPEGVLDFLEIQDNGFRRVRRVCQPARLFSIDASEDGWLAVTTSAETNGLEVQDRPPKAVWVWNADVWAGDTNSSTACMSRPPDATTDLSEATIDRIRDLGPIRWTGRNREELVTGSSTEMLYLRYAAPLLAGPALSEPQPYPIRDRFEDGGRNPQAFAIRTIPERGDFELWAVGNDNAVYRQDLSGPRGNLLGSRGEVEVVPIPLDPPLLPRLAVCGPGVNLKVVGLSSAYAYFGGLNCKYLFQMRLDDRAFSLVDPDPNLAADVANKDSGIRALDVRADRVAFGGIGGQLYVFP